MSEIPKVSMIKPIESYEIDMDPVSAYKAQASVYISKMNDITIDEAKLFVNEALRDSDLKDPDVLHYYREENGDKEERTVTLSQYLKDTVANKELIAPSFTTYISADKLQSHHGSFIMEALKKRKYRKNLAKEAKSVGDIDKFLTNNVLQKSHKLSNNSLSGAYCSKSTNNFNSSAHSSLTSSTRIAASIGNALSEMMVSGLRHYRSMDSVLNHFAAIIEDIDLDFLEKTLKKFDMRSPTIDEVMSMVNKSSRGYWKSKKDMVYIKYFVTKLTETERAAVMFVNDLYHLKEINSDATWNMLDKMSKETIGISNDISILKNTEDFVLNIAHHICMYTIKGEGLNYSKFNPTARDTLVSTVLNLKDQIVNYEDLTKALFQSRIMPIDIVFMKEMIRAAIALSDTDSTCSSYTGWIKDRYGKDEYTARGTALAAVVLMFNSETLDHFLKQLAANFNASKDKYNYLAMKNEFFFPSFVAAEVSKHYFADIAIQEGLVFKERELEIKGVNLIATNIPKEFSSKLNVMMRDITETLSNNELIDIDAIIKNIANMERDIIERAKRGDVSVLKLEKIKEASGYKKSEFESPVYHYNFYNEIFREKYGEIDPLPITAIKVPTLLSKKKQIAEWVETIKDEVLKEKFIKFFGEHPKESLGIFRMPNSIITAHGIPEEILPVLNSRRIVFDCLKPMYMLAESLGFYGKEGYLFSELGY